MPLAITDNEEPEHNVSAPLKSVVKLGNAFTVIVMPEEVTEQPLLLVTSTVTTSLSLNVVEVNVAVLDADPCELPFTKNS